MYVPGPVQVHRAARPSYGSIDSMLARSSRWSSCDCLSITNASLARASHCHVDSSDVFVLLTIVLESSYVISDIFSLFPSNVFVPSTQTTPSLFSVWTRICYVPLYALVLSKRSLVLYVC